MAKKLLNQKLLIEQIVLSAGTQQRQLCPDVIKHYTDLRKDKIIFPPVEVINTGHQHILWDGFHRIAVAKNLGDTHIRANVEIGSDRHAVWMSYHANSQHGFARQAGATKMIVDKILGDEDWSKKPVADIASHCGCSRQYVYERKSEICQVVNIDNSPVTAPAQARQGAGEPRTETEQRSPLHDGEGQTIPPHLADMFLSRSVIKTRINDIDKVKNAIENSLAGSEPTYALLSGTSWLHSFNTFRAVLKAAIPYAICPYCKGEGCGACHETGFLNEMSWKAAPKDQGE